MTKTELLDLLSKKDLTFRQIAPAVGSAIAILRTEIIRKRIIALPITPTAVQTVVATTAFSGIGRSAILSALQSALTGSPSQVLAVDIIDAMFNAYGDLDDVPLRDLQDTAILLEQAHLYRVATIAGGADGWVAAIAHEAGSPLNLLGPALAVLVDTGALTPQSASAIGLSATIYEAVDRELAIAQAIRSAPLIENGNQPASSSLDLARLTATRWHGVLVASSVVPRAGTTQAELAARLADRFSMLHPGRSFTSRLPTLTAAQIEVHLVNLQPLLERNRNGCCVFPFEQLDSTDISGPQLELVRIAHAALRAAILLYPGLELEEYIDNEEEAAAWRAELVARRISAVHQITSAEREGFLRFDYGPRSDELEKLPLDTLGISVEEQRLVLRTLKSYQRVYAITGSVSDSERAMLGGFASARAIAAVEPAIFASRTAIDASRAQQIHTRARDLAGDAAVTVGALLDAVREPFAETTASNLAPSAIDYLRELDGFEQLFGSLSFCKCEACRSILGPAAYFVDLMKFIDERIRVQFPPPEAHALDLQTRRSDLWNLELTCANTADRIPLLQIVDEILETYIAKERALPGFPEEQRKQVYVDLATAEGSCRQPFHRPLARAEAYLAHLESDRAAIASALESLDAVWTDARLGISPKMRELVTTQDLELEHHRTRYGVDFQVSGGGITPVDVQGELLPRLPLDRDELDELIQTQFVRGSGATPHIVADKRSPESMQNDVENLHGLTVDALDRMHRMIRLRGRVPWSFAELDRAMTALGIIQLDAAALEAIAKLREVQLRFSIESDEASALVGALPGALIERVFNDPAAVAADGVFPQPTRTFIHPAFRDVPASANPAATRLAAALGTTMGELELVILGLRDYLTRLVGDPPVLVTGFSYDDSDPEQRGFVLSEPNLRLLYRHVRVARLLGITIPQLLQLARSANVPVPIETADAVLKLAEVDAWRRTVGYRIEDIATRTRTRITGVEDGDPDPVGTAARIVVGAAEALTFQPMLFAVALGVTEIASSALIAQNPALFSPFGARWRIADGVDLDTILITIPDNAVVAGPDGVLRAITADEVRAVMFEYRGADLIARRLASALAIDVAKLKAIAALTGTNLDTPALTQQLLEERAGYPLAEVIVPLMVVPLAFQSSLWEASTIEYVRQHAAAYAISTSPFKLTVASLRALAFAESLLVPYVNSESTASDDLRTVVEAYVAPPAPNAGFPVDQIYRIAQLLRIDLAQLTSLLGRIAPGPSAVLTLEALSRAAHLATELGIDGEAFTALLSSNYDDLSRGADALLAAVRARYPEDAKRAEVLAQLDQPLLEQRRDALADLIVRSLRPDVFATIDDLSPYFLIDVRAGGCQSTSRVIAATSAAQLYVHRVIMRLEQDRREPSDPLHLELRLEQEAIEEWAWRKNYRVWEANRKVFLWPESYLEPDLRDDKTPLFAELEQTLLQGDVNEQTVLDAYAKYLAGFEELANLTIAGAYHDVSRSGEVDRDVLHLFGVSSTEPPTYYYRTCEDLLASTRSPTKLTAWTPWRKINVQISGRRVAPIVHGGRLHVFWTDTKTRSRSQIVNGANEFDGYQHTMRMRFTTLRLDGSWTAPQEILLPSTGVFSRSRGVVLDRLEADIPWLDDKVHVEALDDYTLQGVNWDSCWPETKRIGGRDVLMVRYRDFLGVGEVDLFGRELRPIDDINIEARPQILCARGQSLYHGSPILWFWGNNSVPNLVIEEKRLDVLDREGLYKAWFTPGLYAGQVATLAPNTGLLAIPGNVEDAIVQVGSDIIALQGSITADHRYVARRIGTTLANQVARILFSDGVDGLLDLETQRALHEAGLPLTPVAGQVIDRTERDRIDFTGPYGTYYREIFFHIPFSIANHLNGQGQFAAAQRWYQHIFNPTSTEVVQVPSNATPGEREKLLRDRVWRYLELRGLAGATIRDILTDPAALASYRRNPFNPHAIARLRLTAYQKAIVMKYVDNLLDWGDHLFTQFTMESVNEALLLYLTAADILGRRPAELGACGEAELTFRDYAHIAPLMDGPDDLLIELETWLLGSAQHAWRLGGAPASMRFHAERTALERAAKRFPLWSTGAGSPSSSSSTTGAGAHRADWNAARVTAWAPPLGGGTTLSGALAGEPPARSTAATRTGAPVASPSGGVAHLDAVGGMARPTVAHRFPSWLVQQLSPVFCVPPNRDLLAYWDRVEDRLYKIRNCMDIAGQKRELALLAPEIDPAMMTRAQSAGFLLDDQLDVATSNLPPYRFLFLIDRAKAFAGTLQGFGASLLNAIEKRDGEELARLRHVHQKNVATFSTRFREWDIQIAQEMLASTEQQRDAAAARQDFYQELQDNGRSSWEIAETAARHTAAGLRVVEGGLRLSSGVKALLPRVGSPLAMTYGGLELSSSENRFAGAIGVLAVLAEGAASSAQLEGNYERRREGWRHQRDLAKRDLASLDRQVAAAQLRLKTAERSLELHQRSMEQLDEVFALMEQRFSNFGLYTWLTQQLQRLYRDAYHNAMSMARLAERAFRFERGEDAGAGLESSYWDAGRAGLLAGERLLIGLQHLERRFLETNHRTHEVDQAFSLAQIDPAALVELRETGTCELEIPEFSFDQFYPGHYKRRIKGVRLTMPCITGPYVNVSATLELLGSKIRTSAAPGAALVEVPPQRTTSIATSTAQNDAGVFELSFRDERYMPFEEAGAISRWRITLPKTFRPFDYHTINDVILSISYAAEMDSALRTRVEHQNAAIEGSLLHYVANHSLARVFSLRQDFSSSFTRLLRSPVGTEVRIELADRHFPLFAQGKTLTPTRAVLVLRTAGGASPGALALSVDGGAMASWSAQSDLGGLLGGALPAAFTSQVRPRAHTLTVSNAGGLAPANPADGAFDPDKLHDVLIVVEYRLT